MKEERIRILNMLKDGKISAEEAEELLGALDEPKEIAPAAEASGPQKDLKYFRILVEPVNGKRGKKDKVNVRVPIALLRAGAKLTTLLPQDARGKIDDALKEKGTGISLGDLEGANIEPFLQALGEMSIDVDTEDAQIKIFCE